MPALFNQSDDRNLTTRYINYIIYDSARFIVCHVCESNVVQLASGTLLLDKIRQVIHAYVNSCRS